MTSYFSIRWLLLLSVWLCVLCCAAQRVTLSGYVVDAASGETLIGASVSAPSAHATTVTNAYGFFSVSIPTGQQYVRFGFVGYGSQTLDVTLQRDTMLTVRLKTSAEIDEVVVRGRASDTGIDAVGMGSVDITTNQIKHTPTLLGETDVMRTIQMQPGVQSGLGGGTGLYVRGGSGDENLILLDGVPLYKVDHLFGFFSVFNADAIKKVSFYKSSFPTLYTGRLSSVIDVRAKDGDLYHYHGSASLGPLSVKLNMEGPIVKGRTSFNLSLRRTYLDWLIKPFEEKDNQFGYDFYDVNLKLNHRFSDFDRLYLSFYHGHDNLEGESKEGDNSRWEDGSKLRWGNTVGALRWNHVFGDKLFANITASYNRYDMNISNYENEYYRSEWEKRTSKYESSIRDRSAGIDFDYHPQPTHHLRFGAQTTFHQYTPQAIRNNMSSSDSKLDKAYALPISQVKAVEWMSYVEDKMELGERWQLNTGLAYSAFHVQDKTYHELQPRLSLRWQAATDWVLKAAFSKTSQYIHLLTSMPIAMPTDIWVPITKSIPPMQAYQYSAGVYFTGVRNWAFSLETYYKDMHHVMEYKDGMNLFGFANNWENLVSTGEGRAYGVELMTAKTVGRNTFQLAYTLSKSERKFSRASGVNAGERFPYAYDRRHVLNAAYSHRFCDHVDIDASWMFYTGGAATIAGQVQRIVTPDEGQKGTAEYVSHRNNYRMPVSHMLNVGVNFHKMLKNHVRRTWNLGFYNLYNAMNPTIVYMDWVTDAHGDTQRQLRKFTLLPFIPSFNLKYEF